MGEDPQLGIASRSLHIMIGRRIPQWESEHRAHHSAAQPRACCRMNKCHVLEREGGCGR